MVLQVVVGVIVEIMEAVLHTENCKGVFTFKQPFDYMLASFKSNSKDIFVVKEWLNKG